MTFGELLLLAIGLSMDAMAVAVVRGLSVDRIGARHVALVAGLFGGFQALMPLLGWAVGVRVGEAVAAWDHWLIFAVLAGIGGKMVWEALRADADETPGEPDPFALRVLLALALATSIDALAAGFTLPLMDAPLGVSILTIGATTAVLSGLGLFAGHRFGASLVGRLDALGGVVLIGLGTRTLIDHLVGG